MGIKLEGLDKVEAWSGGAILGVGQHVVRIESAIEGKTRNENPQVELEFAAVDGSGTIRDWLVITPATLGKVKSLLNAVMIEPPSGEWEFEPSTLLGKKLSIIVGEEPDFNDPTKTRKRVQAYELAEASDMPKDDRDLPF